MKIGMRPYPEEVEQPCEVCGEHIDACQCPECPSCGYIGDPKCYRDHALRKRYDPEHAEQIKARNISKTRS